MAASNAWWKLQPEYKDLLQEMRERGRFGGATAAGAGWAPYFWSQEFGNPLALIKPQEYVTKSLAAFQSTFLALATGQQ